MSSNPLHRIICPPMHKKTFWRRKMMTFCSTFPFRHYRHSLLFRSFELIPVYAKYSIFHLWQKNTKSGQLTDIREEKLLTTFMRIFLFLKKLSDKFSFFFLSSRFTFFVKGFLKTCFSKQNNIHVWLFFVADSDGLVLTRKSPKTLTRTKKNCNS